MAACGSTPNSIFGSEKYIKFSLNSLLAIDGPLNKESLDLKPVRFPYNQILKSRVILKKGEQGYLLNHLGLGDNATFLAIKATYDPKSKDEEKNYIEYYYFNDESRSYYFAQMILLTGNSIHRIPQLYLSNPNPDYPITLEVMVAIIDDKYFFFEDDDTQSITDEVLTDLLWTNIVTWTPCERLAVVNSVNQPLVSIPIEDIQDIKRENLRVIITMNSDSTIILEFRDNYNALQGFSVLNWVLENPCNNIANLNGVGDTIPPVIQFTENVNRIVS